MKLKQNNPDAAIATAFSANNLGISQIVTQLRDLRLTSLETRKRRDKPPKLPSRKALQVVVEGLAAALFLNRLGLPDLKEEGVDYFVGHLHDHAGKKIPASCLSLPEFTARAT